MYQNIIIKNYQSQHSNKKDFKPPKIIKKSNKQKVP